MVKVFEGQHDEFYMDGFLRENLNVAKDVIRQDWDMTFVVDGAEGSGKSVFAMQMAYFCDPTITLDRVVFTPRELMKAVREATKYQAIIYDEAYTGLSARAAMSLINRTLVKMFAEMRQKNLFVFVVMPCFFDLDKYLALWRSRALIHVYTGKKFERGMFRFYNVDRKKTLYVAGKKFYSYHVPKPNFFGRFTNHYPLNQKEYRQKKLDSLTNKADKEDKKLVFAEVQKEMFLRIMADEKIRKLIPNYIKAKILGISEPTIYNWAQKYEDTGEL